MGEGPPFGAALAQAVELSVDVVFVDLECGGSVRIDADNEVAPLIEALVDGLRAVVEPTQRFEPALVEAVQYLLGGSADDGLVDDRVADRVLGAVYFRFGHVERPAGAEHAASLGQGLGHSISRNVVQGVGEDDDVESAVIERECLAWGVDVAVGMVWVGLQSSPEHLSTAIGPDGPSALAPQPADELPIATANIEHIPTGHLSGFS